MKKILLMTLMVCGAVACTSLPQSANNFISTYFAHTTVQEVERESDTNGYSVKLKDRTEIEFAENGDWLKVEAEDGNSIPTDFFPKKIADYAAERSFIIELISKTNIGYKVEIVGSKSALFFNKAGDPIGNY